MWRKVKYILISLKQNLLSRAKVFFIAEPVNWVIDEISRELSGELNRQKGKKWAATSYLPFFLKNKIIHFATISALVRGSRLVDADNSNKVVLTWYHIVKNDPRIELLDQINKKVKLFHTACNITKQKLIENGINSEKIVVIPESINLNLFKKYSKGRVQEVKKRLQIPECKKIIGSFQKDGCGWGEGLEPKPEKGPDVFCGAIERIVEELGTNSVHILLTGPARGYVKKRLDEIGVSYTHHYLKDLRRIVDYYNVLDLYIVASREEGGPKAILESMACGVPLVSTKVGMAPDVIKSGENGILCEIGDVEAMSTVALEIIQNHELSSKLQKNGLETVKRYELSNIAKRYIDELYDRL